MRAVMSMLAQVGIVAYAGVFSVVAGPASVGAAPPPPPKCYISAGSEDPIATGYAQTEPLLSANALHSIVVVQNVVTNERRLEHRNLGNGAVTSTAVPAGRLLDITPDGHYALYLRTPIAFGDLAQLLRIDLSTMTQAPIPVGGGYTISTSPNGSHYGEISDDGSIVATQGHVGGGPDEVLLIAVSNGAVTQITTSPPPGDLGYGPSALIGISGDANFVAVRNSTRRIYDRGGGTSVDVPGPLSVFGNDVLAGNGRYLFTAQGSVFDRVTQQTTIIVGSDQRFAAVSDSGRYVFLSDLSRGSGADIRGVVLDRMTSQSTLVGAVSGLQQGQWGVADDGQTVLISDAPMSLGPWTRPTYFVSRAGLPDIHYSLPISIPIGGIRVVPLDGLLPAGTTVSFGVGTAAPVVSSGGHSVLFVAAADSVVAGTRPMIIHTPDGCQLEAGIFHFSFVAVDLIPIRSVVHPGETITLDYRLSGLAGFTPSTLDIGQSSGGSVLGNADPTVVQAVVTMAPDAALGFRDLELSGADPDDSVTLFDAAVVRSFTGEFHPVAPARVVDTRDGTGGRLGPLTGGTPARFKVTGVGGVPAAGVDAVVMNVTVAEPTASGFLTVWPANVAQPTASNLNFVAGQAVPNLVTTKVSPDGFVNAFDNAGQAHVIFDVVGWYSSSSATQGGAAFVPLPPTRLLDTREDPGAPLGPQKSLDLNVTDPDSGITAVVLNVTVTGATAPSYLSVVPSNVPHTTSNLNFVAGQTVPNLVVVPVGPDGDITFYNNTGSVHVVADLFGIFDDGTFPIIDGQLTSITPTRMLDTRSGVGAPAGPVVPGTHVTLDLSKVLPIDATSVVMNVTVTEPTGPGFARVWASDGDEPTTSNLNYVAGLTVPNLVIVPVASDGTVQLATSGHAAHLVVDLLGWYGEP